MAKRKRKQLPFRFFVLRDQVGNYYSSLHGFQPDFTPITQCTRDIEKFRMWSKLMHGDKCDVLKCSHGYYVEEVVFGPKNFVRYTGE